jgi:hypothetical protein
MIKGKSLTVKSALSRSPEGVDMFLRHIVEEQNYINGWNE